MKIADWLRIFQITHILTRNVLSVTVYTSSDSLFTLVCKEKGLAAPRSRDGLTPTAFGHAVCMSLQYSIGEHAHHSLINIPEA